MQFVFAAINCSLNKGDREKVERDIYQVFQLVPPLQNKMPFSTSFHIFNFLLCSNYLFSILLFSKILLNFFGPIFFLFLLFLAGGPEVENGKNQSNIDFRALSSKRSDLSSRNPLYSGSSHAHPSIHTPAPKVSHSLILDRYFE